MSTRTIHFSGLDPREATDKARRTSAVVHNESGEWVILGHEEALAVANDPETFSSAVGNHLQIPNGLDGTEHSKFRTLIDKYLTTERVKELEPVVAKLADDVVAALPRDTEIDAIADLGNVFAARTAITWLGWDPHVEAPILEWVTANHDAARAGNREMLASVAAQFDGIVRSQIGPRIDAPSNDVTSELMMDDSLGRQLTDAEVVSILRNWTGGDISSIALCIGVIVRGLAESQALFDRLRDGNDAEADAIIDELLRLDSPFVSNRRKATCPVTVGGQEISEGERVHIHWTSANRDESVFGTPFDEKVHASNNLVYGSGPHVCPGRDLSTMELRVVTRALIRSVSSIELAGPGEREVHPVGGWAKLPVVLQSK